MLSSFLSRGLTPSQALPELAVVIAAGTDNFATATQAVILCIITHPRVYHRLQQEIDNAGDVAFPVPDATGRSLPYLQACINEGMRRFPPDTQLRERMVAPEGDTVNGYFLPGGTFVGLNSQATQHDAVYGSDTSIFRPERWLESDQAKVGQMYKTLELLFSHGTSKCLGYNMTYMEMGKIVFELFRNFDVEVVDLEKPWKRRCRGSFVQEEFCVRVQERKKLR
jgi:cytochrome P450